MWGPMFYEGGPKQKWNYLLEDRPVVWYRLPQLGECSRNPCVSVYQLALLWEAAFSFSDFFFWRLFERICPSHDVWFMITPAHTMLSVQQFLTKKRPDPGAPPSLFTQSHPNWLFLLWFSWMKSPHRETFCQCGRGETKNSRSTKSHLNQQVQKLFWAMEKMFQ